MQLRLVFVVLGVLAATVLPAQPRLRADSGFVEVRSFNAATLQEWRQQRAFAYHQQKEPAQSLWDRFWRWFWFQIDEMLRTRQGKTTLWSLGILFVIAAVLFVMYKSGGMSRDQLFGRAGKNMLPFTVHDNDIHSITFDEAIEAAVAEGNYRQATRLRYLQVLKRLTDQAMIDWQINKTNTQYVQEAAGKAWQPAFSKLTNLFEYTWYGEANIGKDEYAALQRQFQHFNALLP